MSFYGNHQLMLFTSSALNTVNLQTNGLKKEKYFTTSNTIGSFNTIKNNIEFGTGLLG